MNDSMAPPSQILLQRRAESWMFLAEAARDLRTVGAVAPSGKALARALTAAVGVHQNGPLNVLEAGAGTGAVTRALIAQLSPGSHLDVVDANPRFAERLRSEISIHPLLAGQPERVRVHEGYVEQLDFSRRYDVIVSGLPLTNFTAVQVETIMDRYLQLLRPGATLTYFAYLGTRFARGLFSSRAQASRHQAVDELMSDYQRRYGTGCERVWVNVPPARVWRLQRPAQTTPAPRITDDFAKADQ